MPNPIPDRWIPYKACGAVIEGTRIICFKVPLRKTVQVKVRDIKQIWDIPAVLAAIPNLCAVIDLTNTQRYYRPQDFVEANVLHKKILMPGRVLPPESKVKEFMDAVDEFLGSDCDSLVGVHCTHGLNRTGYMVCRYMRDRLFIPGSESIKRFEAARGYKIERPIYINDILGLPPPSNYTPDDKPDEDTVIPIAKGKTDVQNNPNIFNKGDNVQEVFESPKSDDYGYTIRRNVNTNYHSNSFNNKYRRDNYNDNRYNRSNRSTNNEQIDQGRNYNNRNHYNEQSSSSYGPRDNSDYTPRFGNDRRQHYGSHSHNNTQEQGNWRNREHNDPYRYRRNSNNQSYDAKEGKGDGGSNNYNSRGRY